MVAMPQYLVNKNLGQPGPQLVPPPKTTQAVATPTGVARTQRIRVNFRAKEGRSKRILLGTINHCEFRVIKAIPVCLEVRLGTVVASWRQIDEFGTGKSMSLACDDLGHTIAELYTSLKADEARLGPD